MGAQEKWLKAIEILNNNPSESELKDAVELINEAVADGHAGAHFTLAILYLIGKGLEPDKQKAFDHLQKSYDLGYERSKLMLATFLIEGEFVEKDLAKAEQYLRELAEQDDVEACVQLAQNIFNETFPNDEKEEGVAWLRKAADLGYPTAMALLGQLCGNQCKDEEAHFWFDKARSAGLEGVDEEEQNYTADTYSQRRIAYIKYCIKVKDYAKVTDILERDANNGDTEALYLIADFYINGMGEEQFGQDVERGLQIYQELSDKGDANAHYMLGQLYGKGPIEHDYDKAMQYYLKAAEAGHPDAQYGVGYIYSDGFLGEVNKEEAAKWIELAVEQNQRDALFLVALSYIQDPDVITPSAMNLNYDQNIEKGVHYLKKAAYLMQPNALYVLAQCYHIGKYVEKDDKKAFICLWNSVRSEAMPANVNLLGDFYRDGIGTDQDFEAAAQCYQWAADNGDTDSMMSLGNLDEEGIDVEKNEEIAAELKNRCLETLKWKLNRIKPMAYARELAKNGHEANHRL